MLEVGNVSSIMSEVYRILQFNAYNLHIYALISCLMVGLV